MLTRLRQCHDRMSGALKSIFRAFLVASALISFVGCERDSPGTAAALTLPAKLRVLCWNLHRCESGVGRIEAELVSLKPDLLFLQEAEVANDADATAALLPRLAKTLRGFEIVSADAMGLPPDQHCDVAILSRWPIRSVATHSLEAKGWVYAIEGVISTDAGDLTLMSVHTHATWRLTDPAHVRDSAGVRMRQIDAIVSRAKETSHPALVAGDFNAPAGTVEAGNLATGLVDLAGSNARKPTTPAILPVLRLDYVFANRPVETASYEVINVNLSDHRPVMAIIAWPVKRPS